MAITTAIADLFHSATELLSSLFHAIYAVIHTITTQIIALFTGILSCIGDLGGALADALEGVIRFVLNNAPILAGLAAAGYIYLRVIQPAQTQGAGGRRNPAGAAKKAN
ncbi:hypothetical protein VTJ49DRAFT_1124 [Mycothermus thermophilus]|uniref:Uncharacterized protein n=1 Tax=Humicola insolens TaxID=85995 RepID=A0ABR3VNW9_HUMIN